MTSAAEDSRSKRGGHRLFDHSRFPDVITLKARGEKFLVSASYLALHSPHFYKLFYGAVGGKTEWTLASWWKKTRGSIFGMKFKVDCDPKIFGDLLDLIYPCYKKTSCCSDCSSSLANRLSFALQLKMRFAVKRLILDNMSTHGKNSTRKQRVAQLLVILSVHFDTLLELGAKQIYEFCVSETKKHIIDSIVKDIDCSRQAQELLDHFEKQGRREDTVMMKELLNRAVNVKRTKEGQNDEEEIAKSFQMFVKGVDGKTITIRCASDALVQELKKMVELKTGINAEQQRLIFGGRQIEDGRLLSDYKIGAESTCHLMLRITGC